MVGRTGDTSPVSPAVVTPMQGCSLETLVLVSRRLEDMKNGLGLGLEIKVLVLKKVLVLVLMKKSQYFQDINE